MRRFLLLILVFNYSFSQGNKEVKVSLSGYLETFYSYNSNKPVEEKALPFMYNYNRQNEFNVNNSLIRAKMEYENVYASIAFHSGTYVNDNYANETIKYLSEAYFGLFLDKAKKQTVEVGIMPSFYGFETACSHSNLTLTRSILGENSPYFMTGVKYAYKPSEKWNFSTMLANGWQKINKPIKKALPSFGTQVVYKPKETATLNWSVFVGDEPIGTDLRTRYFSNLYYDFQWKNKFRTIAGFDFGYQIKLQEKGFNNWYSPVLITQYSINSKWQTAVRMEYYQDVNNVMIASNGAFKTLGSSLNIDYLPNSKVKFRTEARYFNSKEAVFLRNENAVANDFFITTSLSFEF
jgi:hypothetical protein